MKKLVLALVVALTLAPFSAFALEMMSDDNMKGVTAQAGVAIAVDDIVLVQNVGKTKYFDLDGTSRSDTAEGIGAIFISERRKVTEINAIYASAASSLEPSMRPIKYSYPEFVAPGPLTIDVGKCAILSYGLRNLKAAINVITSGNAAAYTAMAGGNADRVFHMDFAEAQATTNTNVVGVQISLPTVEIYTATDVYSIGAEIVDSQGVSTTATGYFNNGREFISIRKEASALAILGGRIEIAPK
jgi:hypothetical protein